MKATFAFALLSLVIPSISILGALAQVQCGSEAGGAVCPNGLCCSKYGYCGTTSAYCCDGCQSQCTCVGSPPPPPPITPSPPTPTPPCPSGEDISSIISEALFNEMLKHRTTPPCQGGFLTYDSFIAAAKYYCAFGNTGDIDTRKREIAAFFGQTSQETTGGWDSAPDGRYAWGYCFLEEQNKAVYCQPSIEWPCAPGKQYYGRGPIQLTWNYNYGQAGRDLGVGLLNNPDLVMSDPVLCFRTSLWFWMTPQAPKPSSHAVITGQWTPSPADISGNRLPGYGVITNIINGGIECGPGGQHDKVLHRIGFYKRYCDLFGISPGDNLDCYTQRPFNWGLNGKIGSILPGNHVAV